MKVCLRTIVDGGHDAHRAVRCPKTMSLLFLNNVAFSARVSAESRVTYEHGTSSDSNIA